MYIIFIKPTPFLFFSATPEKTCPHFAILGQVVNKAPARGVALETSGVTIEKGGPNGLNSWVFTGAADSYVALNGAPLNLGKGSFTMATYIYQDVLKNGPILEWRGASGSYGTHVWVWQNKLYVNLDPISMYHVTPAAKSWHFVGVSYNHNTGELVMWVDDKVLTKNVRKTSSRDMAGTLYVGKRGSGRYNFQGKMAGLELLTCATNKDEIAALKKTIDKTGMITIDETGMYNHYVRGGLTFSTLSQVCKEYDRSGSSKRGSLQSSQYAENVEQPQ